MRIALFVSVLFWLPLALSAAVDPPAVATESVDELDARIARLINELGAPEYATRERAQRELARLGLEAFEALTAAKEASDVEIASQARYLVRQIRFEWVRPSDPPELSEILKAYEGQSAADRLLKINQIAALAERPNLALPGLEWLCRLACFEESQALSKEAALKAIALSTPTDVAAADAHFATIARTVARGRRPAALWLKAYSLERADPNAAAAEWDKLLAAEEQALEKQSETTPQIVSSLLRRQVTLLDKLNRPEDSLKAIARLVQMERGDTESLLKLVDWLRERKAWNILDDLTKRFTGVFTTEPILLYALAQARADAGDSKLAEESAAKAFALRPDQPNEHSILAGWLLGRGQKIWAEREFRMVLNKLPLANEYSFRARLIFSEDLHDQLREAEAADVLQPVVEGIDQKKQDVLEVIGELRSPEGIKSRMLYFRACDAQLKGDVKRQTELLDQGIAADPTDADVLIALYRLPNQDEARRQRTKEQIQSAAADSRQLIDSEPDFDGPYNQFAWLVANTEGDFDEALRCALKCVEIRRVASYLDTLAHCYYAKGDYENAVITQEEAAKLDPHTNAITRQLKVFKEALAKQQAEEKKQ